VTTRVEASVMEQSFCSRLLENVPPAAWRCKQLLGAPRTRLPDRGRKTGLAQSAE